MSFNYIFSSPFEDSEKIKFSKIKFHKQRDFHATKKTLRIENNKKKFAQYTHNQVVLYVNL